MADRMPAMVWPLASFLAEEMDARGWTCVDVAERMPGEYAINIGIINLMLAVQDDRLLLTEGCAEALATAFGSSADYFIKLDRSWRENPAVRQPFECPEHLLDGLVFPTNDNAEPTP